LALYCLSSTRNRQTTMFDTLIWSKGGMNMIRELWLKHSTTYKTKRALSTSTSLSCINCKFIQPASECRSYLQAPAM
jgi:hypothetical protein